MSTLPKRPTRSKSNHSINDDLKEKLTALAFDITDNFCYGCYQVVKDENCPSCGTDDFMRQLEGVGVEYGVDWVIEHLIKEHCNRILSNNKVEDGETSGKMGSFVLL